MHYLFLFLSCSLIGAATSKDIQKARAGIMALISPLLPGAAGKVHSTTSKFRVDGCKKHKINWKDMLLMQKEVELRYSFKEGCDIQGTIRPKLLQEFPAKLSLRHLEGYDQVESMNTIRAQLESSPLLVLELRSGVLSGKKGKVKFESDYQVQLDLLDPKDPLRDNKGGELRITEIHGKQTNIKERIKLK